LMKLAMNLIGGAAGAPGLGSMPTVGAVGMAHGGSGVFGGIAGVDKNVLSLNGLPIAKVSRGEPFEVGHHLKGSGGGGNHFSVTVNGAMSDREARRTGMQIAIAANQEMARARTKGIR
jgi:hypothetical protein